MLAEPLYSRFASIELKQPFEKSMAAKQKAMSEAIKGFNTLVPYEVADVTAAATFYMAQVYASFSRSLNESERPTGLDGTDLQDYNDQLDEMAFPFEEKAIGLHEKNIELMEAGVHSPWIEKSLASLAQLVPARYARPEASSGFLGSGGSIRVHPAGGAGCRTSLPKPRLPRRMEPAPSKALRLPPLSTTETPMSARQ